MNPKLLLAILNAAHTWEISATELRIMLLLDLKTHNRPSEIARALRLTTAGAGGACASLAKRRILRKKRNREGADERGVTYSFLPYGKLMLESILGGLEPTPGKKNP
jgi:DNA-binding MarR family transcriptional regulator